MAGLISVHPPRAGIYRLARGPDPLSPPDWAFAKEDGTFGNRFDDPTASIGNGPDERFRAVYCSTQRRAAFGETLARFRVSLRLLADLNAIEDDESTEEALSGAVDPEDRSRGLIPADWRVKRRIQTAVLDHSLPFVDLGVHETMQYLRAELAEFARDHTVEDVDLSALTGPQRPFTQYCARYIYDISHATGVPRFAGIRYVSRLDARWKCWAIFADRLRHTSGSPGFPYDIPPDNPDLLAIAQSFNLTIEVISGVGTYIRP
jgi:hypothetical protein